MGKIAYLFPGQGSQIIGMGKDVYDSSKKAKEVFDQACDILNMDVKKLCFEGPEEALKQTINTQPCILTTSIALLEALKEKLSNKDIFPTYTAGHSLGEYAAMYCSNVLDLNSVLKLIKKRSELMDKAASLTDGAMSAIIGLDSIKIEEIISEVKDGIVSIANYNSPSQTVITGEKIAVEKANELLNKAGAKRVVPLSVSGAFHSMLMKNAAEEFKSFIEDNRFDFKDTNIPIYTNVDATSTDKGSELKSKCYHQLYSPVKWCDSINKIAKNQVTNFIEIGPGKVLKGLNLKINKELNTVNVYDNKTLEETCEWIKNI